MQKTLKSRQDSAGGPEYPFKKKPEENWGEIFHALSSVYAWVTPERFVDLTMRQVQAFLGFINRSDLVEFYNQILSYRIAGQKEIPSFDEFMHLALGEAPKDAKAFDETTDKFLEEQALRRLNERQIKNG